MVASTDDLLALSKALDQYGEEGWELVAVVFDAGPAEIERSSEDGQFHVFLKRPRMTVEKEGPDTLPSGFP